VNRHLPLYQLNTEEEGIGHEVFADII